MKIIKIIFITLVCFMLSACIAGIEPNPVPPASAVQAPALVDVSNALITGGPYCMNPGGAWSVVLPDCTWTEVDAADRSYALDGLTAWLAFDEATRMVSLNGVSVVPDYDVRIEVTYRCFSASDPAVSDSITFTINDCDTGSVRDKDEIIVSKPPLVDNTIGYVSLTDFSVDAYRPDDRTPSALPLIADGLVVTDGTDDTGDLDGDGISNDVEIYTLDSNVFVQVSTAALTASTTGIPQTGRAIGYGDFNNDTFNDVIVGSNIGPLYMYLWNDAADAFDPPTVPYIDAHSLDRLAVSDFNGDGNMDAAVISNSNALVVLYGNGTGALNLHQQIPLIDPHDISRGDLNGDGHVDLVLLNEDDILTYLYNPVTDLLEFSATIDAGNHLSAIAAGDFNGDNILDVAAIDDNLSQFGIFIGDGTGQFAFANSYAIGNVPREITLADFNMDGFLDAAISIQPARIAVFTGRGDGTFAAVSHRNVSSPMRFLTAADMNGDNAPDLVMFDSVNDLMIVGLNTFKITAAIDFTETSYPLNAEGYETVVCDINQNNMLDIVATDTSPLNQLHIYLQ
jgi:hypothetical protein